MSGSRNSFNSPTGVQEPNRLRSPSGSSGGCQAYTESGAQCKESRSLKIIDEIQHLYEDRLRRIDDEAGGDGTQLKLKTLTAWVNDLGEQNTMLVQTVEQLEREASDRVALLEEQLQRSSRTALGYMTKLQDYDHQMNEATGEKIQSESTSLKISSKLAMAQQTEEALRARVCSLQSDIGSLLELIRRARQDGCWETDGLNFCEVTFEDIFGSSSPYQGVEKQLLQTLRGTKWDHAKHFEEENKAARLKRQMEKNDTATMTESPGGAEAKRFELEAALWKKKITDSETELLLTKSELRRVESNTQVQHLEVENLTKLLQDADELRKANHLEHQRLADEVATLSLQLRAKSSQVDTLVKSTTNMEKSTKDMREALTAEVADKHDQILAMRREAQQLEERCRQADMQTHFRDDIIKEMRKDIKFAKSKLAAMEMENRNSVNHGGPAVRHPPPAAQQVFGHYQPQVIYHRQERMPTSAVNLYDPQQHPTPQQPPAAGDKPDDKTILTILKPPPSFTRNKVIRPQLEETGLRLAYIPEMADIGGLPGEHYLEVQRRSSPPSRDLMEPAVNQVGPGKQHASRQPHAWSHISK